MPDKTDIFITYHPADGTAVAEFLYDRLSALGYRVGLDDGGDGGAPPECSEIVAVLSKASLGDFNKPPLSGESVKPVIPFILSGFDWPGLGGVNACGIPLRKAADLLVTRYLQSKPWRKMKRVATAIIVALAMLAIGTAAFFATRPTA